MEIDGHSILFDPFLTGNPLAAVSANEVSPEIIFLSHAHGDHYGDTVQIAKRTGAKVVTNADMCGYLGKQGLENLHPGNTGGGWDHGIVHARFTQALHSSSFPDGTYGGNPNGFYLTTPSGLKVYFAGDTDLFSDMSLIGDWGIDVAFLPIGDNFTMGPAESLKAIHLLRPRYVVPMHYKTFGLIDQDGRAWGDQVSSLTNASPIVLDPGDSHEIP
jgi:L-ascorbate metabolism protein UlaG (beta-lactamase superfamily)